MGAKYEALPRLQGEFTIKKERFPDVNVPWHVHPEYELSFVCMQGGSKHVGSFFGQMKNEEALLI